MFGVGVAGGGRGWVVLGGCWGGWWGGVGCEWVGVGVGLGGGRWEGGGRDRKSWGMVAGRGGMSQGGRVGSLLEDFWGFL